MLDYWFRLVSDGLVLSGYFCVGPAQTQPKRPCCVVSSIVLGFYTHSGLAVRVVSVWPTIYRVVSGHEPCLDVPRASP